MICLKEAEEDSWARIELWRWQYGHLPIMGELRPLDISKALNNLSKALERGERTNYPTPMGVITILRYVAKILPEELRK